MVGLGPSAPTTHGGTQGWDLHPITKFDSPNDAFPEVGVCGEKRMPISCSIAVVPHTADTYNLIHETSGNIVRTTRHRSVVGQRSFAH
jgi:hypothetical protein